jgi:glycine hydroxymethyltransferase
MTDYLFRGSLADLDPEVFELTQIETERQSRKLILIASESTAPLAIRQAMASTFQNIYAEGYPDEETREMSEADILDYPTRLAYYRRYSDPRYYKGTEYADIVEALARRRCAELFAANGIPADKIFVNVQPLSGAPANNAVYHALANPGDTIMGMDLIHGGHLSHGSPANRSGKIYNAVHYMVDPETEKINYDSIETLAQEHKPKFIIAGYSSYPWSVDWARLRAIADNTGAYLFADIAHVAGLIAGGVYPSPLGYAHVITFTTHKSLCGPRGACILTTDASLARKLDKAVFPGEQGGPHVHIFAAMALTFKLAKTEQFRQLQAQVVKNSQVLANRIQEQGLRIAFGGTDTHLVNVDCTVHKGLDGAPLTGDQAARLLDIAGIVVNRNTIPGDKSAFDPSGLRMGSVWVTQRGFKEPEMVQVADLIGQLLKATTPFHLERRKGEARRAKVDFTVLEEVKMKVRALADQAGRDNEFSLHGYPHFYFLDDHNKEKANPSLTLTSERVREFVNYAFSSDVEALKPGDGQPASLFTPQGEIKGSLHCNSPFEYTFNVLPSQAGLAAAWLRDLSDGFVAFDDDPLRKLPGPVLVQVSNEGVSDIPAKTSIDLQKPYFIGRLAQPAEVKPAFTWDELEGEVRKTPINLAHRQLGAKMIPFAGWDMPVWYSTVMEEHMAVRNSAGLFDVAHMGVYQAEGPDAAIFLDSVVGNDIGGLGVGESCYTHFLDPDANVIDDLLVYHRGIGKFLVVVNASNDDKDWDWLNAVKDGQVLIDHNNPGARAFGRNVVLRNLRDPRTGTDMRVDIALQGPRSREIVLALGCDTATRKRIMGLTRTQLCDAQVGGFDLVVSRTGYTGERMAFELFIHPEKSESFFQALLKAGEAFGLKPCGLGARDSLRTEAGLPLYGHEMGGDLNLGVAEAGFGSYVKTYKPWFIGREAFLEREKTRKGVVVRFRFNEKGVRMAHLKDPVLDKRGRVVGMVTSCAVDKDGLLTGQAFVELKSAEEGTQIFIYQSAPKEGSKAPLDLKVGDRAVLPTPATIVSRFMK